ncbi:MAG TPA: hypothetical protein VFI02_19770, partial [Armatimonadota bacterium]|nr:hypothetical protein [Armatimonadota bacterium]
MALPFLDLDNDILDGDTGLPFLFPRDANHSPAAFIMGVEEGTSTPAFGQFTPGGRLLVEADLAIPGEIKVGAVEIEDRTGGSTLRLDVVPIGALSSGADNNHGVLSMGVDENGVCRALPIDDLGAGLFTVPVSITPVGVQLDPYNEEPSVAKDTETAIVSRT